MNCLLDRRLRRAFLPLFLWITTLHGDPLPSEQQRLVATAKIWNTIKYFHPSIALQSIDWDQALVAALPAIRNAKSDAEWSDALKSMLAALHDPETYVGAPSADQPAGKTPSGTGTQLTWIHHGYPSALPGASRFYQAFLLKQGGATETVVLPIDSLTNVQVRISEPGKTTVPAPAPLADSDYPDSPYPSVELRILAAFRIWGVIHSFYGYKDLMDEDWDAVFADTLPKFITAKNAAEYHLVVAEMISRLSDSNCTVSSHELDRYFGEASPGVEVRLIEKKPVLTKVDAAAQAAGLRVGDVVTSVDGERLSDRIKREANYLSVSTAQGLSAAVATRLLNGAPGSDARLVVSRTEQDGPQRLSVKRSIAPAAPAALPSNDAVRTVSQKIGYADLRKLSASQVPGMFAQLKDASAIIFDARGPIAPLAQEIASCLARRPDVTTAVVTAPLALEPDLPSPGISTATSSYFFMETVRPGCTTPFKGKTVMLIDERTVGSAEHLGLALEAANGTEFLGTPSAGADSTVTEFSAPGGIRIQFSGEDVRHFNGAPIQRMGLQPSLALAPTIAAIRAGRDVVLEKAIEYLRPPSTQASLHGLQQVRTFSAQANH